MKITITIDAKDKVEAYQAITRLARHTTVLSVAIEEVKDQIDVFEFQNSKEVAQSFLKERKGVKNGL